MSEIFDHKVFLDASEFAVMDRHAAELQQRYRRFINQNGRGGVLNVYFPLTLGNEAFSIPSWLPRTVAFRSFYTYRVNERGDEQVCIPPELTRWRYAFVITSSLESDIFRSVRDQVSQVIEDLNYWSELPGVREGSIEVHDVLMQDRFGHDRTVDRRHQIVSRLYSSIDEVHTTTFRWRVSPPYSQPGWLQYAAATDSNSPEGDEA